MKKNNHIKKGNASLPEVVRAFAAAVYRDHSADYDSSYQLTQTADGITRTGTVPPTEYIVALTDWFFIMPLAETTAHYEEIIIDSMQKAVKNGRLTPAGEALYQMILLTGKEAAKEAADEVN